MAFKECMNGVAWSKGIGKIWRACDSPSRKNSTSHLFWLVQTWSKIFTPVHTLFPPVPTCSHLFTPVHTCSQLFTTVHTCAHLFTPVHTCSHLLTPAHTSVTIHAFRARAVSRWIFPLRKLILFDHVHSSRNVILLHFRRLLFFSLAFYPAEIAYFNSPNRALSNGVGPMKMYWNKIVDPSRSPCLKTVQWKSFERRNFSVLHPNLLKLHALTWLIESFPMVYGLWSCIEIEMSIPLGAHA